MQALPIAAPPDMVHLGVPCSDIRLGVDPLLLSFVIFVIPICPLTSHMERCHASPGSGTAVRFSPYMAPPRRPSFELDVRPSKFWGISFSKN